jgi:hypothetical protein
VGFFEGTGVGFPDLIVGSAVGIVEGLGVGYTVGMGEGKGVGYIVGNGDGTGVGSLVGLNVGTAEGRCVGSNVGSAVGSKVGSMVGFLSSNICYQRLTDIRLQKLPCRFERRELRRLICWFIGWLV